MIDELEAFVVFLLCAASFILGAWVEKVYVMNDIGIYRNEILTKALQDDKMTLWELRIQQRTFQELIDKTNGEK